MLAFLQAWFLIRSIWVELKCLLLPKTKVLSPWFWLFLSPLSAVISVCGMKTLRIELSVLGLSILLALFSFNTYIIITFRV